ncbi:MAG: hypothetical protein LBJ63_04495 [Prevotellaceae bacterium]|nr:hypothetical protein [Prevotellaceae bacterium]
MHYQGASPGTRRNRGVKFERIIAELNLALRGWLNYFRWAKCHKFVQNLDAWIRRKLVKK